MKVQLPFLAAIGSAINSAVLQKDDSVLQVPSAVFPKVPFFLPHRVSAVSNIPIQTSIFMNSINFRTNEAAWQNQIAVMPKGLYKISAKGTYAQSNTTGASSAAWYQFELRTSVYTIPIDSYNAFAGGMNYRVNYDEEYLFDTDTELWESGRALAVGDFLAVNVAFKIDKIL